MQNENGHEGQGWSLEDERLFLATRDAVFAVAVQFKTVRDGKLERLRKTTDLRTIACSIQCAADAWLVYPGEAVLEDLPIAMAGEGERAGLLLFRKAFRAESPREIEADLKKVISSLTPVNPERDEGLDLESEDGLWCFFHDHLPFVLEHFRWMSVASSALTSSEISANLEMRMERMRAEYFRKQDAFLASSWVSRNEVKCTERRKRKLVDHEPCSRTPKAPRGWIYLVEARELYGVPGSTLHRYINEIRNENPNGVKRHDSGRVLVRKLFLEDVLRKYGRLDQ